jgi:glycosyltransferase involved in cell wall biosynthesis
MVNYNGQRFIDEAIQSVALQQYRTWELIIVDSGSSDESWEIIGQWSAREQRITPLKAPRRLTIPEAANLGLAHANGEYVARIDSDDIWLPQRLDRQMEFMERSENADIGVCGTNCLVIDGEGKETLRKEFPVTHNECLRAFWFRNPLCQSATLIRKVCFERCGLYDESFTVVEDLELFMRFGQVFRLHNLPEYLVKYRISGSNVTICKHKNTVENTLRARRLAFTEYGYPINLSGRIAFGVTWCMQWLPPSLVHRLFYDLLLRRCSWLWRMRWLPREKSIREVSALSTKRNAGTKSA